MTFLFGGEPFDKPFDKLKAVNDIEQLKALSKAEGTPPNKRPSSMLKHALFAAHSDGTQL